MRKKVTGVGAAVLMALGLAVGAAGPANAASYAGGGGGAPCNYVCVPTYWGWGWTQIFTGYECSCR